MPAPGLGTWTAGTPDMGPIGEAASRAGGPRSDRCAPARGAFMRDGVHSFQPQAGNPRRGTHER